MAGRTIVPADEWKPECHRYRHPGAPGGVFPDTCVYHQPGIDLSDKVIPVKNMAFAAG